MIVLRVLSAVLLAYLLLLSLRIVLSWFRASLYGRPWALLERVTEPYLAIFRRIRILRQGALDLSSLVAVLALVVVLNLVNELLVYGRVKLGFVLASVLGAVWSGASFLLLLFAVISVVRLVGFGLRTARNPGLWKTLDMILQPVAAWMTRLLSRSFRVSYVQTLALTAAVLLTVWFLGGLGVLHLGRALRALPV